MRLRFWMVWASAIAASGCADPTLPPADGGADAGLGAMDAALDGAPDATGDGATTSCSSDGECDDLAFCNGLETCAGGRCSAGTPPCAAGSACNELTDSCASCSVAADADGDGHRTTECGGADCDDADANRFPGNLETCDAAGHDEDCDPTTYGFRDADGDGEPDARCCNGATCGVDCDDMRPGVRPGATETCNAVDDDCDAMIDEGVQSSFYADLDGDGFGDPLGDVTMGCFAPVGYSADATDCNDGDRDINPARGEVCDGAGVDENCDGTVNPPSICTCTGTASRSCMAPGACAAGTENCSMGMWGACSIAPIPETCNGVDDDCNGVTDDGLRVTCFVDADNDGYAAVGATQSSECFTVTRPLVGGCPVNFTDRAPMGSNIDCDDGQQRVSPAVAEVCNAIDDNCNGTVDEALTVMCWADADNDTYPPAGAATFDSCPQAGRAGVGGCPPMQTNRMPMTGAIDCADTNPLRNPGTAEACNSVDDNCNGTVDEGVGIACYADADGDTFAPSGAMSVLACGGCPVGRTSRVPGPGASDCDDGNNAVFPGAFDTCDATMRDEDCDGTPNNPPGGCACTGSATQPCCAGRGFQMCTAGSWGPCSVAAQPELCNGADDDCDGAIDNGVRGTCYADADMDSFAPAGAATMLLCAPCNGNGPWTDRAPGGTDTDCNDANPNVRPGAPDPCDGIDNDCDGAADPGFCRIGGTCYANGVANPASPDCQFCNAATPATWTSRTNGTACDDANVATCTACMSGVCSVVSGGNCADALSCTTDICNAGPSCTHPLMANTCLIGGVCYASGAQNPANPCQSCQPSVSTTAWSVRANNSSCGCSGTPRICCSGTCVSAGMSPNCGGCGSSCTRGCFLRTFGGACLAACTRTNYSCCPSPDPSMCDCF